MTTLSPAYEAALKAHDAAAATFRAAQDAYRAKKIGDQEFVNARLAFICATADFDEAFNAEAARQEAEEAAAVPAVDDSQGDLFA